jgi:methionyl-tRNA formyltransferase
LRHGIPVLQPARLKSEEFAQQLHAYHANLQVVVAFRMLPESVWKLPELGTFNLHASLLPDYRGAAPINRAIMNGEKVTGVTTFFLQHAVDTGHIIFQETEPISPEDDAGTLYNRLKEIGARLVLRTVRAIESGTVNQTPQPEPRPGKEAPKIFKEDCRIDWNSSGERVCNFVRGLSPYPAAWTTWGQNTYKIFKVKRVDEGPSAAPGGVESDQKKYLHVRTADGWISVLELQPEGKKRMTIEEFFRGNKIPA